MVDYNCHNRYQFDFLMVVDTRMSHNRVQNHNLVVVLQVENLDTFVDHSLYQ